MRYEHDNLNEYEKNIMGYIYAFSALGFIPIEIEIYNARVVMGARKKKSDGEYMYKFNEMDLDKKDYSVFSKQIIDEANDFYVQLVERGTDARDLANFRQLLMDLENNKGSIWDMGNMLVQYMNEYAPMWLRDRFFKHKYKVSESLNMLLRDASFTQYHTKGENELDGVIRNLNQVYQEQQMNMIEQEKYREKTLDELNGRVPGGANPNSAQNILRNGMQPRLDPRRLLQQMARTFALSAAIFGM